MSSIVLEKHAKTVLNQFVSEAIAKQAKVHATRLKRFYSLELADRLHAQSFLEKAKA